MKRLMSGCLKFFVVVIVVAIIAVVAMSSGGSPAPATPTPMACLPANAEAISAVVTDPEVMSYNTLSNFRMVRAEADYLGIGPDMPVYFLAADITGPDLDETLVWATNGQHNFFSADTMTAEFSMFPLLADTRSPVTNEDPAYTAVIACP